MAKQLLNNIQTTLHYSKGVKTALKNLFSLWNNGKKKVKMELTRNLFLDQLPDVPAIAQEEFLELLNARAAKINFFDPMELGYFWLQMKYMNTFLNERALRLAIPFQQRICLKHRH